MQRDSFLAGTSMADATAGATPGYMDRLTPFNAVVASFAAWLLVFVLAPVEPRWALDPTGYMLALLGVAGKTASYYSGGDVKSLHDVPGAFGWLTAAGGERREVAAEQRSPQRAAAIDDEVSQLVAEAYKRATAVLNDNRTVLDELAEMLVERETVDAEDLQELLIRSDVRVAAYV